MFRNSIGASFFCCFYDCISSLRTLLLFGGCLRFLLLLSVVRTPAGETSAIAVYILASLSSSNSFYSSLVCDRGVVVVDRDDIDDVEIMCSLVKGSWIVARKLRVTGPMRPR